MRILHLTTALSWRGGEQQIGYLLECLDKQGVEQSVVCARHSKMEAYCIKHSINHVPLKKKAAFDIFFAWKLKKICSESGIALIHIHDAHAHTFAILSAVLFNNKIPLVVSRRVDFPVKPNWFSRFKYNHQAIRKIICVSDKIKELMSFDIKDRDKLVTIHSGIDISRFENTLVKGVIRKEYSISGEELLIGNIAAIAPHKDYFTYVDTVKIIAGNGLRAKYLIIGEGPEREQIKEYIASNNLQEQIILTGFREDITDILPELDIFLTTSKTEGLGTSILDAFASGVPVVATAAGGIPEIVIHGETGLLAPVKDADKLAENVMRIVNNDKLREKLVENACKKLEHFTKEQTAMKTLQVYDEICKSKAATNFSAIDF